MENLKELKKNLRKQVNKLHDELSEEDLKAHSRVASDRIIKDCEEYKSADVVYAFVSFGREIDTSIIINNALENGKRLLLPRVHHRTGHRAAVRDQYFHRDTGPPH